MQLTIKAHFNKMTKDSKKELVQFYVFGDDEKRQELNLLCREIVELNIAKIDPLTAEFVKKSQDAKKTVLDFIIKGGTSTEHSNLFYSIAGTDVELTISESQMSIDEFKSDAQSTDEEDEEQSNGLEIKVNADGTAEVIGDKEPSDKVTDIASKRAPRTTKTEKAEKEAAAKHAAEYDKQSEVNEDDQLPY